jgi:hypothetical protein
MNTRCPDLEWGSGDLNKNQPDLRERERRKRQQSLLSRWFAVTTWTTSIGYKAIFSSARIRRLMQEIGDHGATVGHSRRTRKMIRIRWGELEEANIYDFSLFTISTKSQLPGPDASSLLRIESPSLPISHPLPLCEQRRRCWSWREQQDLEGFDRGKVWEQVEEGRKAEAEVAHSLCLT